ncbi:MAG: hypothetical protein IJA32_11110 [Lachnospiraceae bacterium]|nr:hypothetical protein [Lachnospiraceae bacterium]
MKKYIRTERANLFEPNVYISMVLRISGHIPKEEVKRAVEKAYKANEATMSRIVMDENGDAYYEKMKESGCKFFYDNRSWERIINESEQSPFAIHAGELVRTYMTSKNHDLILLIHAHHLVGDGKSILVLVKDMIDSLEGKSIEYKQMFLIDRKFLRKKTKLMLGIRLAVKKANRKWKRVGRVFTWDDYYTVHKRYWEKYSSEIEVKTYSASKLKENCKKDVTLNSYLITKLLCEYPESKVVGIPINIRENDRGMSNQTSGIAVKCQYKKDKSFEENLLGVHKQIYKRIKNRNMKYFILLFMDELCPTLVDSVLMLTHGCFWNKLSEKMARIMGYIGNGGRDLGVTNLGKIEILSDNTKFKVEDIWFIPPKISYTRNVIGVSTYGDTLTVCYHKMKEKVKGEE